MYEYNCTVERVVDGDTIDVVLDLGFSVLYSLGCVYMLLILPSHVLVTKTKKFVEKWLANFFQMLLAVVLSL